MNPALRALNRFGLGARPGETDALGEPRAWLMAQLDEPPPLLDDPSLPTAEDLSEAIRALREAQRARDTEAEVEGAVRGAPSGVLVQPPVRVGGGQATGRAPGGWLRTGRDPAPCIGSVRGHGSRLGAAPGDAPLPGQRPVDRAQLGRRTDVRSARSGTGPERKLCTRVAGAAHPGSGRRLYPRGRAGSGPRVHGLDRGWPKPGRSPAVGGASVTWSPREP